MRGDTCRAGNPAMSFNFFVGSLLGVVVGALAGCASQPPVPFQLVDQQSVAHTGVFRTQDRSMDVSIAGKDFHGFYIVATGTAVGTSDALFSRRFHTVETFSSVSSNAARAVLKSADGESITCEFLFEGLRAVGDCRSSAGKAYQLVAAGT